MSLNEPKTQHRFPSPSITHPDTAVPGYQTFLLQEAGQITYILIPSLPFCHSSLPFISSDKSCWLGKTLSKAILPFQQQQKKFSRWISHEYGFISERTKQTAVLENEEQLFPEKKLIRKVDTGSKNAIAVGVDLLWEETTASHAADSYTPWHFESWIYHSCNRL